MRQSRRDPGRKPRGGRVARSAGTAAVRLSRDEPVACVLSRRAHGGRLARPAASRAGLGPQRARVQVAPARRAGPARRAERAQVGSSRRRVDRRRGGRRGPSSRRGRACPRRLACGVGGRTGRSAHRGAPVRCRGRRAVDRGAPPPARRRLPARARARRARQPANRRRRARHRRALGALARPASTFPGERVPVPDGSARRRETTAPRRSRSTTSSARCSERSSGRPRLPPPRSSTACCSGKPSPYDLSRAEARAEQVGSLDLAVSHRAEEMLLDDVRFFVLDTGEAIGDVKAVADLVRPCLREVEHRRVADTTSRSMRPPRRRRFAPVARAGSALGTGRPPRSRQQSPPRPVRRSPLRAARRARSAHRHARWSGAPCPTARPTRACRSRS